MSERSRILVTGATGFFGAALARSLAGAGHVVSATRRPDSDTRRLNGTAQPVRFYDSERELAQAAADPGTEGAIVHAATCYGRRGESLAEILDANVRFPLRLLEASAARGVRVFINIDTSLPPETSAYALSKKQFSDWGKRIAEQTPGLRFVNVRLEHIYGPGDDATKFITGLARRCLAGEAGIPLTEGRQRRDFIHVDDAVSGLRVLLGAALAGRLPAGFSSFDLGSGAPVSIREIAETIHRLAGGQGSLAFGAIPYRPGEVMESSADLTPISQLGWTCTLSLEQGLKELIDSEKTS